MKIKNNEWEEPMTPSAILCELVARFGRGVADELEVGERPSLYVNKVFARALMVELMMHHGAQLNEEQMNEPKHFAFGESFVFINDKLFPQEQIDEIFYAAAFKRPL
jgi:hypothetical protein